MTDTTADPDPTKNFKPFSLWTDEEIQDRAMELHGRVSCLNIDLTQPVRRIDDDLAYLPAWIEICPWD